MDLRFNSEATGGGVEGEGIPERSKTYGFLLLFGTPQKSGCGLMDIYILVTVMYALAPLSTPPKPMLFHRFSMVPGNAPGRQNPGGALTISTSSLTILIGWI